MPFSNVDPTMIKEVNLTKLISDHFVECGSNVAGAIVFPSNDDFVDDDDLCLFSSYLADEKRRFAAIA
jgi:hypothetical protein